MAKTTFRKTFLGNFALTVRRADHDRPRRRRARRAVSSRRTTRLAGDVAPARGAVARASCSGSTISGATSSRASSTARASRCASASASSSSPRPSASSSARSPATSAATVDTLIMRLSDMLLAFPGILLAIALVAVLGPSLNNVILALSVIGWVGYARLVRGQILKVRQMEFVIAARGARRALARGSSSGICCRTSSARSSSWRRSASPARSSPKRRSRSSASACSRRRRHGARCSPTGRQYLGLANHLAIYPGHRHHARRHGPQLPRRRPDRRARSEVPEGNVSLGV